MTDDTYEVEVPVRFRDLDPMGHVNNAVYATYLEHARDAYFRDVIGAALADVDSVLAHLELDYERPVTREHETVTVAVGVPDLGETSIPMEYEVRTGDGVAATGSTVQVAYDSDEGTPVALPDEWRNRIRSFEGLAADT